MIKKFLFGLSTVFAVLVVGCTEGQTINTSLSAQEFANKIGESKAVQILDVRTPDEFAGGHLANALNVDWNSNDFENQISTLDKSKPVFVYCLSGGRSSAAAESMRNKGFKEVYELSGGILQWRTAGLPETTGKQKKTGMTKQEFDAKLDPGKIVLIDFYAEWCAPCRKMKPYMDEIGEKMKDSVAVVRIDVDANPELAREMGIESLPTLQVYKKKSLTWTGIGYTPKEEIFKQLK